PISGGRGTVKVWDRGTYEPGPVGPAEEAAGLAVSLIGTRLRGTATWQRDPSGDWWLQFTAEGGAPARALRAPRAAPAAAAPAVRNRGSACGSPRRGCGPRRRSPPPGRAPPPGRWPDRTGCRTASAPPIRSRGTTPGSPPPPPTAPARPAPAPAR